MPPQTLIDFRFVLSEANNINNLIWLSTIAMSCHYLIEIRVNWNNVSFCLQLIFSGFSSEFFLLNSPFHY